MMNDVSAFMTAIESENPARIAKEVKGKPESATASL
jgi:hypothetical protein